jgi:hypothetical protein
MSLVLDGTNGLSEVDGSAATPAIRGTDTNTGIFFPAADTIAFAEGGAEVARFDPAGNFGLGVTPSAWNSVLRAIQFGVSGSVDSGASSLSTRLNNNAFVNAAGNFIYTNTGVAQSYQQDPSGNHIWRTAPSGTAGNAISFTQAMTLDASGNLLVGTTSGTARGLFIQDGTGSSIQTGQTNASFTGTAVNIRVSRNTSNGTYNFIGCAREQVADVFFVRDSGNVVNANNSYGGISDAKLKENVTDATPKLEKLQQVRVVNYNLIGEEQKQLGVVAQELEQIFPGMIDESPDRDAEGNDLGTTTKSVKYSVFVPMLIKAIQEQQAIITALTAQVAALDARLISLEGTQP